MPEEQPMSEKKPLNENFKPDTLRKNYVPPVAPRDPRHGVEGNHVPPTTNELPATPPPNPKKK
jgi:hypothetical protein